MSSKSDVKGFYRQKKKAAGAGKSSKASPSLPKHAATFGFDVVQPPALVTRGGDLDLKGPPLSLKIHTYVYICLYIHILALCIFD